MSFLLITVLQGPTSDRFTLQMLTYKLVSEQWALNAELALLSEFLNL